MTRGVGNQFIEHVAHQLSALAGADSLVETIADGDELAMLFIDLRQSG